MLKNDNVIDNKNVYLKDELLRILPKTSTASIAVGYFFISGLSAVMESLSGVDKMRLLISNTTDKTTAECLVEGFYSLNQAKMEAKRQNHVNDNRKNMIRSDSRDSIKKSLEHMSQSVDDKKVIRTLVDMMAKKQLEVRVYPKEKLHAKAYIFEAKDTDFVQGMGIVGSSNLSLAGLSHNSELNLKTYNSSDVSQLLNWFDTLWDDGLDFTSEFNTLLFDSWAMHMHSPRDIFLLAAYLEYRDKLEEQHKIDPIWGTTFPTLFSFQKNAVDQSLTMIELYDGVIIGDVVGLGKTYIGTAVLKYLQLHDFRPLIVCPPQLKPMWEKFCAEYEVDAKILSRGMLSQDRFDLSRDYRYKDRDLVLIDESHHFRNKNSRQYENLHGFTQARDAKAILLTATPFSNNAEDIKNQIMLFHQSSKTRIPPAADTDLDEYFTRVRKKDADLVDLLQNIMIRRTRRYVLNHWGEKDENGRQFLRVGNERKYFPRRKMRVERYDINEVYQDKYESILRYLQKGELSFARYSIGLYVKDEYREIDLYKNLGTAGEKLIGLIRTLLLKRMESSLGSFQKSIDHYIKTHRIFIELLKEKIIPVGDISYKSIYDLAESDSDFDILYDPDTIEEFKSRIKRAGETQYKFEAFDADRLLVDIKKDIEIFEKIDGLIRRLSWKKDDKLRKLQNLLDGDYRGKKVLIFSEFATTTKYLDEHIRWDGNKARVDSDDRNLVLSARRFDPNNNSDSEPKPSMQDEISLLISTDILSEGVNLQAGEVVINYDFHWNPTRLIQRAGRVDRIGSNNEFVTIHNFLLDPKMEPDVGLEETVDRKIDKIQKQIGEDYPILKPEERINTSDTYAIYRGDESVLDREGENPLEPSRFEQMLRKVQVNDPKLWSTITSIPRGARGSDGTKIHGSLLLACESRTHCSGIVRKYYLIKPDKSICDITAQQALRVLESSDMTVHTSSPHHDHLLALGWNKFIDEIEQIRARGSTIRLTNTQKWIRAKLLMMSKTNDAASKNKIDTLLKAYQVPITKGKLNRELLKLKKANVDDKEMLDRLSQLYLNYELQNRIKEDREENTGSPVILYSIYLGCKQ